MAASPTASSPRRACRSSPVTTFLASFCVNFAVAVLLFVADGRPSTAEPPGGLAGSASAVRWPAASAPWRTDPRPGHVTTPQGGPQAYGDAEAESLREDLELTMGDADSRHGGAGSTEPVTQSRPYQILSRIAGLVAAGRAHAGLQARHRLRRDHHRPGPVADRAEPAEARHRPGDMARDHADHRRQHLCRRAREDGHDRLCRPQRRRAWPRR